MLSKAAKVHELWDWPEWIAFANRLGIDLELPTQSIVINIDVISNFVKVSQGYIGQDKKD